MLTPFEPFQTSLILLGRSTTETGAYAIESGEKAAATDSDTNRAYIHDELMSSLLVGECRWAPFSPYLKTAPEAPVPPEESSSTSPFAALSTASMPFLNINASQLGCHATEHKQYGQQTACLCSLDISMFRNYKFLNLTKPGFNSDEAASVRNMMQFMHPKFCQTPQTADIEKFMKITRTVKGSRDTSAADKAAADAAAAATAAQVVADAGAAASAAALADAQEQATTAGTDAENAAVAAGMSATVAAQHSADAQAPILAAGETAAAAASQAAIDAAELAASGAALLGQAAGLAAMIPTVLKPGKTTSLECAVRDRKGFWRQGLLSDFVTDVAVCLYTPDSDTQFKAAAKTALENYASTPELTTPVEFPTGRVIPASSWMGYPNGSSFPALMERQCCTPVEYLFTGSMNSPSKVKYDTFQLSADCIVMANNVIMATMAYAKWHSWRRSRSFFLMAWAFPFLMKFLQFSIPAYWATGVNPKDVSERVMKYTYSQLGFDSYDNFANVTHNSLRDNLAVMMPKVGGSDLIYKAQGCHSPVLTDSNAEQQGTKLRTALLQSGNSAVFVSAYESMLYILRNETNSTENFGFQFDFPEYLDGKIRAAGGPSSNSTIPPITNTTADSEFPQGAVEASYQEDIYTCFAFRHITRGMCNYLRLNQDKRVFAQDWEALCYDEKDPMSRGSKECLDPTFAKTCSASCASWSHTAADWKSAAPYVFQYSPKYKSGDAQWYKPCVGGSRTTCAAATDEGCCKRELPPYTTPLSFLKNGEDAEFAKEPADDASELKSQLDTLLTCDPSTSMAVFSWMNSSVDPGTDIPDFDSITDIPALGPRCRNSSNWDKCFSLQKKAVPIMMDQKLTETMAAFENLINEGYLAALSKVTTLVNAGVRVKASGMTALGLLPITLALLPGFSKGAKKLKMIIPQSPLVGYILLIVPPLQLPMLACILCVLIQLGGTWHFWLGIYLFLLVLMLPILKAVWSVGSHENGEQFKLANQWWRKSHGKWTSKNALLSAITAGSAIAGLGIILRGVVEQVEL